MGNPKTASEYESLPYPVELHPDSEGGFFARHPDLPGCTAEGETADEAVQNLAESRVAWIEARLESGYPVPVPPGDEHGGRISLRIPRTLHANLAQAAVRREMSLNQLLTVILAEWSSGVSVLEKVESEIRQMFNSMVGEESQTVVTAETRTTVTTAPIKLVHPVRDTVAQARASN